MKDAFIAFRDYVFNEKQKYFLLKRLLLCKYLNFWRGQSVKNKNLALKLHHFEGRYHGNLQIDALKHWKDIFRDNLVTFHLKEFEQSYSRSYYVQIWRDINLKNKVEEFRSNQIRQILLKCIVEWRDYVMTKQKISEIEGMASEYFAMSMYSNVWQTWKQRLFDNYTLMDCRKALRIYHGKYLLNRWRDITHSNKLCRSANRILLNYQKKRRLLRSFSEWQKFVAAKQHYKHSLINSAFCMLCHPFSCIYHSFYFFFVLSLSKLESNARANAARKA